MHKLHEKYMAEQESSAPKASESPDSGEKKEEAPRKKNYFERNRFVGYEPNQDSDNEGD